MNKLLHNRGARAAVPSRQRGVVLYVALVVMVVMMLAGVAVLRAVGTGQGVAGNLSFKQNAVSAGDRGVNAAMVYLVPPKPAVPPTEDELADDQPANGYFATWGPTQAFDPASFAWDTNPTVKLAVSDDGTGNRVRYVIHRLCPSLGRVDPILNQCVVALDGLLLGTAGGGASASKIPTQPVPPYYRVTTRIDGPRNTVSYTQVVMK